MNLRAMMIVEIERVDAGAQGQRRIRARHAHAARRPQCRLFGPRLLAGELLGDPPGGGRQAEQSAAGGIDNGRAQHRPHFIGHIVVAQVGDESGERRGRTGHLLG